MTGDLDAADILAAARRGLSPTSADAERVRGLMEAALQGGAAGERAVPQDAPRGAAGSRSPSVARGWLWLRRFAALGAVAAVAGGVGYRAGRRASRDEAIAHPPVSVHHETPAQAAVPPPKVVPATPAVSSTSLGSVRPARDPAHRPAPIGASAPAPASMAEEVRVLRSVERALRENRPGFALALLRELDRSVPNGQLTEERLAVRTIARCASGAVPFGVNLAEDFADRYPASVYGRRVTEACGATDPPSAGDQKGRRQSQ
jgi:hypothetical protein